MKIRMSELHDIITARGVEAKDYFDKGALENDDDVDDALAYEYASSAVYNDPRKSYEKSFLPSIKNKIKSGKLDLKLLPKLFLYLVEQTAPNYSGKDSYKEYATPKVRWLAAHYVFDIFMENDYERLVKEVETENAEKKNKKKSSIVANDSDALERIDEYVGRTVMMDKDNKKSSDGYVFYSRQVNNDLVGSFIYRIEDDGYGYLTSARGLLQKSNGAGGGVLISDGMNKHFDTIEEVENAIRKIVTDFSAKYSKKLNEVGAIKKSSREAEEIDLKIEGNDIEVKVDDGESIVEIENKGKDMKEIDHDQASITAKINTALTLLGLKPAGKTGSVVAMSPSELKKKYLEKNSGGHFFDRETMKFFGQSMKDFKVKDSGEYWELVDTKKEKSYFFEKETFKYNAGKSASVKNASVEDQIEDVLDGVPGVKITLKPMGDVDVYEILVDGSYLTEVRSFEGDRGYFEVETVSGTKSGDLPSVLNALKGVVDEEIRAASVVRKADNELVGGGSGVYQGQEFAEQFGKDWKGISPSDMEALLEGPDNPDYFDAWDRTLSNAYREEGGTKYILTNDEGGNNLWETPVKKNKKSSFGRKADEGEDGGLTDDGFVEQNLLIDEASAGVYIPKKFVENFEAKDWGVKPEDEEILLSGPDNELYWDTWDEVIKYAEYKKGGKTFSLYQDGSLWAVIYP